MTKLHAKIVAFVRDFIATHGYSPSFQEIAEGVGTYATTARLNVIELHRRGYLIKGEGARNIRLTDEGRNARAA
jgi:hypothetical protein